MSDALSTTRAEVRSTSMSPSTPKKSSPQNKSSVTTPQTTTSENKFGFETTYNGQIQLIFGNMFAGKTSELLRRLRRYQYAQKECILIKYINDVRYSQDAISTHDLVQEKALPTDRLERVAHLVQDYHVIGIDEGQFFPDLVEFCEAAANGGKIVIVSALDGTFQRKPFGNVLSLIPMAESVVKLKAVCMVCGKDAAFSKRIVDDQETELIGGSDMYIAVCRKCFMTRNTPFTKKTRSVFQESMLEDELDDNMDSLTEPLDGVMTPMKH